VHPILLQPSMVGRPRDGLSGPAARRKSSTASAGPRTVGSCGRHSGIGRQSTSAGTPVGAGASGQARASKGLEGFAAIGRGGLAWRRRGRPARPLAADPAHEHAGGTRLSPPGRSVAEQRHADRLRGERRIGGLTSELSRTIQGRSSGSAHEPRSSAKGRRLPDDPPRTSAPMARHELQSPSSWLARRSPIGPRTREILPGRPPLP
jgi:hypothetical protein